MTRSKIFIVEDSFIVSMHLQKTLEGEGYSVVGTEGSGEVAVKEIAALKPDLVLMDIMLSGKLDGIQAASAIKDTLRIPVVFITALTDKQTIQRAKIAEPYGYLTKPFEDREIFTVIEMALYKSSVEKQLKQSEEKFFSTLKSISDGVLTIDDTYAITYANPSAEGMIGLTLQNMLGKSIFDILKLKDKLTGDFPVNPLQAGILNGRVNVWPYNFWMMAHNGQEIPLTEGTVSPVVNTRDQSVGLVLTFKNGTDKLTREHLEEELDRQKLAALIEGQEHERTRIAKDLHDGLGQMLNAIKMNIRTLINDEQTSKGLYTLLDEAITEAKRISENLLPHKLRDFDLITCLKSLCDEVQQGTQAKITFLDYTDRLLITENTKINLYRIAQESLSNAVRHAEAKSITVQLFDDDYFVHLSIEDDGRGMERRRKSNGRGLENIHDRARILRGTCNIESDPSRGTIIIIDIPKK